MNKKDFDILTPTYKEKAEMKERLMQEARGFSVQENSSNRSISVDAEELIEIKKPVKKMRMSGFAAVAAALVCVASVSL